MTTPPHPLNRHLFIADNLDLLRSLDNESIDLICIDPPFAKNQTWVGSLKPPLTDQELRQELDTLASWGITSPEQAAEAGIEWPQGGNDARFKDIWRWENDVHEDWVQRIEQDYQALAKVIDATRHAHSEGTAAYLTYIAIRLIEMHRVLKQTGSLYLHCDHDANGYLRMCLDAVFGKDNLKNEIIWRRTARGFKGSQHTPRNFNTNADRVLFYGKTPKSFFNMAAVLEPYKPGYLEKAFRLSDYKGSYYRDVPFRRPSAGPRPTLCYEYKGFYPPSPAGWQMQRETLIQLELDGDIEIVDNKIYRKIRPKAGTIRNSIWDDVNETKGNERTGYPTQKPVALAERIILASSSPGDIVLDCFAGCAYVPVAAERNERQWIACDISPRALTVLRRQFVKFHYTVDGEQDTNQPALITVANVTTSGPHQLPTRTDEDPTKRQDLKPLPERAFKIPASIIPDKEMLAFLLDLSGYTAWCCGFANRMSDGTLIRTTRNFHLDHLDPKSKDGSNQITNRAPLCPDHNIRKNDERLHLADYRVRIAKKGEMMVNTISDLVSLPWAEHQAMEQYAIARMKSGIQPNLAGRV